MAGSSAGKDYKPLLDALLPVLPDQGPVRQEREAARTVKKAVEDFLRRYSRRRPFPHTRVLPAYDPDGGPEEKEAAWALVESPAFQRLLLSHRLEESGVLDKIFSTPTALADALACHVGNREDCPAAAGILARSFAARAGWDHDPEYFFDRPYLFPDAQPESISRDGREFWQYYLSTAFAAAFSTDSEEFIGKIIEKQNPSLWWRRAFTGFEGETREAYRAAG